MIRLTLTTAEDTYCFVRADSIIAAYVDIANPNHYTRIILSTGGQLQVKEEPEVISGLASRTEKFHPL